MVPEPQFACVWFTGFRNPKRNIFSVYICEIISLKFHFLEGEKAAAILLMCTTKNKDLSQNLVNSAANSSSSNNNKGKQKIEPNSFQEMVKVKCQHCRDSVDQRQAKSTWTNCVLLDS